MIQTIQHHDKNRWYPLINDGVIDDTKEYEGKLRFLHKDTKDKVTVGPGFNVDRNPKKAHEMGMYWGKDSKRRATLPEVERAFKIIEKLPKGKEEKVYNPKLHENIMPLYMKEETMNEVLRVKLGQSEQELKNKIRNFNKLPYPARQALLDMQFNMGSSKFNATKWPALHEAIAMRDWDKAAQESRRRDVQPSRNKAIHDLFIQAKKYENNN